MDRQRVLNVLREIKAKYALEDVYLFGSFAKGQAGEGSDVDMAVKMTKTDAMKLVEILREAEEKLERDVDIVQLRERMNPFLKERIVKEGIRV